MSRRASWWRFGLATLLTPFIASLAASIAITLYFSATSRYEVHPVDGIISFFFLGLFLTPISLAYAILIQIPLATISLRTGRPKMMVYLLISSAIGGILIPLAAWLTALWGSQEFQLIPTSREGQAGLRLAILCGTAGGLSTGVLWRLLVVVPGRPHQQSKVGKLGTADG